MIKKEHRIDTIAWLIIAVICTSVIASVMVYENIGLKQENYSLTLKDKEYQHTIDSLKTVNDTLKSDLETSEFHIMRLQESYEDEISFLGHTLDQHNIQPDYSKFND
jgi:hypothetical protein